MTAPPPTDSRDTAPLTVRIVPALREIEAATWDACALPPGRATNPFVCHAFLLALEEAGCVGGRTGWSPAHVVVETADGRMVGAAPAYLKGHSQGEYVFDHGWADAFERAGGRYYPKVQVSVPFTPATGPRLLVHPDADGARVRAAIVEGLHALMREAHASSIHATFLDVADAAALEGHGFLIRTDQQFHWENAAYRDFDGFLETLASRKRKAIRKERQAALANGITIRRLTGEAITEADWDAFFTFYMDTGSRKWGRPYLNRRFFSLIGASMADRILLLMADRNGQAIAGAINFIGSDTLFGRNWGCIEQHPFLHFEVCYYQAIAFAIERGLARVEAGAQGEHKLARGYLPRTTVSAHEIANPAFKRAIADYLVRERAHMEAVREALNEESPFRKAGAGEAGGTAPVLDLSAADQGA